ncbi:MAG: hypothetical protein P8Y70_19970 [Candidatus Lokiarchaeota archaeon]
MSHKSTLEDLFHKWSLLNDQIGKSFGELDFQTIKEYRKDQRQFEDQIYEMLKVKAPEALKKYLPETCGEMEIGFEQDNEKFYFLMEDPEEESEDEIIILAITIDLDGNVDTIKNFQREQL